MVRNPKFGVGERGRVVLTFETYISEHNAALQVLSPDDAAYKIETAGYDVANAIKAVAAVALVWVRLEIHRQDRRERGYTDG